MAAMINPTKTTWKNDMVWGRQRAFKPGAMSSRWSYKWENPIVGGVSAG